MSINDYVKYVTQTVVQHYDRPKEERYERKREKKAQMPPISTRWFGMLPIAFRYFIKNRSQS